MARRRSGQSGYVVRKGRFWHGRFFEDVPGQLKRKRRSIPLGLVGETTKSEARRKLRTLLEQLGINSQEAFIETVGSVRKNRTFKTAAEWWELNKLKLRAPSYVDSRTNYLQVHLTPHFGSMEVSAITEQRVQEFIVSLSQRGLKRGTIESIVGTLKAILGEKVWRDWSLVLPKASATEQRCFTEAEMLQIINGAEGKWRPFFALLAESGLRFSEAAGLHVQDIDAAASTIHVKRSIYRGMEVQTKTRAGVRSIQISAEALRLLVQHIASLGRSEGLLFTSDTGRPLSKDNVRHSLQRILARLNIPRVGLHSFRHGRVSMLRRNGVPDDLVKEWVGHSSLRVTNRYTHFGDSYRREVAQKVGIFGGRPVQMETELRSRPTTAKLDPSVQKIGSFQSPMTQGVRW